MRGRSTPEGRRMGVSYYQRQSSLNKGNRVSVTPDIPFCAHFAQIHICLFSQPPPKFKRSTSDGNLRGRIAPIGFRIVNRTNALSLLEDLSPEDLSPDGQDEVQAEKTSKSPRLQLQRVQWSKHCKRFVNTFLHDARKLTCKIVTFPP